MWEEEDQERSSARISIMLGRGLEVKDDGGGDRVFGGGDCRGIGG